MRFRPSDRFLTGVVVPVFSLKSGESVGTGEFADLSALGVWAERVGIDMIQILPVNDTGFERSPYSALSAFALHPLYIRLQDLPEAKPYRDEIDALRRHTAGHQKLGYEETLEGKLRILRVIWEKNSPALLADTDLTAFADSRDWIKPYALFSLWREENHRASWRDWPNHQNPKEADLDAMWNLRGKEAFFWVYLQWRLDQQFHKAALDLDRRGVSLKGDIPILINDDSADVWWNRRLFRTDLRAGAPPDHLATEGQNWGFPTYDWDALRKEGFRWWTERLKWASRFYHAYRIDHVLGFFRIWSIPEEDVAASGGWFIPSQSITRKDLEGLGWDDGKITWMTRAHIPGEELRSSLGKEADTAAKFLEKIGEEDLWRRPKRGPTEKEIADSPLSENARHRFFGFLRDVALIETEDDAYAPAWNLHNTRSWRSLTEVEREDLENLVRRRGEQSETLWEENARELLSMMKGPGDLLVCAEDLGVVPNCVPRVLEGLGILALRVVRWARLWSQGEEPYEKPADYPYLSVATTSVHDSTVLRQWLREEADQSFLKAFDLTGDGPAEGSDRLRNLLEKVQQGNSMLTAFPLQDLLALDPDSVEDDPAEERINVPGTVGGDNWTWRMRPRIEDLLGNETLIRELTHLTRIRRRLPDHGGRK